MGSRSSDLGQFTADLISAKANILVLKSGSGGYAVAPTRPS
jgi:hypothetical protein